MHKLIKLGKYIVSHTPILVVPSAMPSLEIPPVANKGAMQMAEVVEYLKPPDAACDASQLGRLMMLIVPGFN